MADFKKLGLDRMATSINRAAGSPGTRALTTGDITKGEVVEVTLDGASPSAGSANVLDRRTGAVLIGQDTLDVDGTQARIAWSLSGNTITVMGTDASTATLSFWVF